MARPSLDRCVKFKALVRRLGIPRPYVRGLLEVMWEVAHESANPVLGSSEAVESAAEWPGAAGVFFEALRDCCLIDLNSDGLWEIHDYWHHCPDYVHKHAVREDERKNRYSPRNRHKTAKWRQNGQSHSELGSVIPNKAELGFPPAPAPAPAPFPCLESPKTPLLDSEEFRMAWGRWLAHCAETNNIPGPTAEAALLARLEAWGPERAVRAIENSIASNYKTPIEPKAVTERATETRREQIDRLAKEVKDEEKRRYGGKS